MSEAGSGRRYLSSGRTRLKVYGALEDLDREVFAAHHVADLLDDVSSQNVGKALADLERDGVVVRYNPESRKKRYTWPDSHLAPDGGEDA